MGKDTYSIKAIKATDRYQAVVDSGKYDCDDPLIAELVCNMCWSYDRAEECRRILDEQGIMVDGLHGKKQNPMQGSYKAYLQTAGITLQQLKTLGAEKKAEEADALAMFNA
ncbi:MAG: hypothetical protein IKF14_04965 [Atopobiaceae bacterium]|nr:hypothetical protein [Atopobiaceae bacterium]